MSKGKCATILDSLMEERNGSVFPYEMQSSFRVYREEKEPLRGQMEFNRCILTDRKCYGFDCRECKIPLLLSIEDLRKSLELVLSR